MSSIDLPLSGRIVLITGGASGIGLALTRQCHELGARVIVGDLQQSAELQRYMHGKEKAIVFVRSDVTRWRDFDALFSACEEAWNDVPDAYGISAGVFEPSFSNFWSDPEDQGYRQVEINVSHPIKLTRMAIRKSISRGKRASVCIVASIAGIAGNVACPIYCATKHAIVGFVKSVKDTEHLTGVKVTTILPGIVNTPIFTPEKIKQYSFTEERALTADQVASGMLDLLQKKEFACGTVQEISTAGSRTIPEWNVSPPGGAGSGQDLAGDEMVKAMVAPIEEILARDRQANSKL